MILSLVENTDTMNRKMIENYKIKIGNEIKYSKLLFFNTNS